MARGMIPLVRLDCKNSIELAKAINSPIIVIPIYDLISNITAEPNALFNRIKTSGGIHNYLDYHGFVILTLIMKDALIKKFDDAGKYAYIINGIKPNAYSTVDGKTYNKKDLESLNEILRLSDQTKELLKLCPDIKPIGHIKGCNPIQIKLHLEYLKKLGINIFIFHVGDFFRNGDEKMIQQAKYFCSLIKDQNNTLFLYGLGAPRRMLEFSFADYFITYSHFVNARNGVIFHGIKRTKFHGMSVYDAALHNFKEFLEHLKNLNYQTKLFTGGRCRWEEAQQEPQYIIPDLEVRI